MVIGQEPRLNSNRFNSTPLLATLALGAVAIALLGVGAVQADPVAAAEPTPSAKPSPKRTHANADHPAVQVARLAAACGVDSNTFLVQPPASVAWTLGPAADEPALRMATVKAASTDKQ